MTKLKCWISTKEWKTYLNINKWEVDKLNFNSYWNTCILIDGKDVLNFPAKDINPYRQDGSIKTIRHKNDEFSDLY